MQVKEAFTSADKNLKTRVVFVFLFNFKKNLNV